MIVSVIMQSMKGIKLAALTVVSKAVELQSPHNDLKNFLDEEIATSQ